MEFLHSMIRVKDLEKNLAFFVDALGLEEVKRNDYESGRFTLIFLKAKDSEALIELTHNWDNEEDYSNGRNFGHLAFGVENIYETCEDLQKRGITILRPPRDGYMAFIKSPDGISVELLQTGKKLPLQEPWKSMESKGDW
jgi:lactoylglutathione lyase